MEYQKEEMSWSISRVLSLDSHLSGMSVTTHLKQPTRILMRAHIPDSYLALLRVGFTLLRLLPAVRCALTTPFHPYPNQGAVYFLLHLPWTRVPQELPGTLALWSPDFPPRHEGEVTV